MPLDGSAVYFVGENLAGFIVDDEFGAFLVGLLDDRVLDLTVDAFIGISSLNLIELQLNIIKIE